MSERVPSWVMVGIDYGEQGVALFASKELSQAELEHRLPEFHQMRPSFDGSYFSRERPIITMTAVMERIVKITAPDWPTAFNCLFRQWNPSADPKTAIAPSVALPPGSGVTHG